MPNLSKLTVKELEELCENNGKHPSGTKEEMITKLKKTSWFKNLAKK